MREGSLENPTRHPIDWSDQDFFDQEKLDAEMRRVFDICHGCRRCFNLCDSFPRLFNLIDISTSGELDSVQSHDFSQVTDSCTLCDMCFMTKCPYVPPHPFNVDFPHLMLRHRAVQRQQGELSKVSNQLAQTDRNGKLSSMIAPLVNWGSDTKNKLTRPIMEKTLGIHREAKIPKFHKKTFVKQAKDSPLSARKEGPAFGQKAVIYATCFCNYNNPNIGLATQAVLAHNGVDVQVCYPGCCGMPNLEQADLKSVVNKAQVTASQLVPWIEKGYDVVALVPSCALMLKQEWPLLVQDPTVKPLIDILAQNTYDIAQYVMKLQKEFGLAPGLSLGNNIEKVTLHMACHARAQNIGQKSAEMLRLIPGVKVNVIERCSGHGGSWGMMVDHFEIALKIGQPVAKAATTFAQKAKEASHKKSYQHYVLSECPLAGAHIIQGIEDQGIEKFSKENPKASDQIQYTTAHPIEILARAYGLSVGEP